MTSAITTTLPGFPLVNQLHAATDDGKADENARENCVPSSIAAALTFLTGTRFEPDELKDAVYGQGTQGAQSAARYVSYCATHGVALYAHNGSQADLIATIHRELAEGHPVLITMPSQWNTAPADPVHPSGYTHVGVMCGYGDHMLRCMNPWGGFFQDESDAWWQARLCYGQVWPLFHAAAKPATSTTTTRGGTTSMPTTSKSSATSGATKTQPSPTAPHYGTGMAAYVATHGVTAASLSDGEQVYDVATGASFAAFANGLVLSYQKGSDVRDDQPADVAAALWAHLVAARAAQTAAERALAQTTQRLSETQAALAKAEAASAKATTSAPTPPAPAPATSLQAALQAASPEALAAALVQSIARALLTAK